MYKDRKFSDLSIVGIYLNGGKYQLPEFYRMVENDYGYDAITSEDEYIVFDNSKIIKISPQRALNHRLTLAASLHNEIYAHRRRVRGGKH